MSASVHCTIARIHDLGGSLGWGGFTTRSGCCTWCSVPRAESVPKMSHTYEFSQSPNKSLRPALISIYESQICSDLQLQVNKEKIFNLNKCILAVRSPP